HAHPEGIAGAIAVAVAAALAAKLQRRKPTVLDFLAQVMPFIPDSEVREKVRHACNLEANASITLAVSALGNGNGLSAQDTVAFALWCAAHHLDNYEEALWLTVSGGGDVDTNCAIVGGIVAAGVGSDGIPATWKANRELMPNWPFVEDDANPNNVI